MFCVLVLQCKTLIKYYHSLYIHDDGFLNATTTLPDENDFEILSIEDFGHNTFEFKKKLDLFLDLSAYDHLHIEYVQVINNM